MKVKKIDRLHARCEAIEECILHLEMTWTDEPIEREEGKKVQDLLRREANRLTIMIQKINNKNLRKKCQKI